MSNKILKNFVSSIDQFLNQFDRKHPEQSVSQKQEIAKFRRIYKLRDDKSATPETKLPEDF